MFKAVLFDLDETLLDRTNSLKDFFRDQALRFSCRYELGTEAALERFLELDARGRVSKFDVYAQLIGEQIRSPLPSAEDLAKDYENNFWRYAKPFDGMETIREALKAHGAKLGIITNGQTHIQLRSLLALNLDPYADTYLISEQAGLRKPDAAIFLRACNNLSANPSDCLFVGDSPEADIKGANAVGMKTVWFDNGATWPENAAYTPDWKIQQLSELLDVFAAQGLETHDQ
ncbi:HAD family hydrolase [Rhodobacteraceae bacterium RKSG542]|uniref:HAD family hydrolase n=1 Tax=Pseudovibrio flavus TaxID=2529854 RepID=UPI0012BC688C|nr:HAD family hydrolase [Pseudovibrio flavus]MTI18598.1 HAD family hydrolase [Pseudovibrio flavus]